MKQSILILFAVFIGCATETSELVKSGLFVSEGADRHYELVMGADGAFSESVLGNPYAETIGENRDTLIFTEQLVSIGHWEQKGNYIYLHQDNGGRRKLRIEFLDNKVRLIGGDVLYTSTNVKMAKPVSGGDRPR